MVMETGMLTVNKGIAQTKNGDTKRSIHLNASPFSDRLILPINKLCGAYLASVSFSSKCIRVQWGGVAVNFTLTPWMPELTTATSKPSRRASPKVSPRS